MLRDQACEGWVVHRRRGTPAHQFRYPVWMLYADVDRLEHMDCRWFSPRRRLAPLSVRAADYPRPGGTRGTRGTGGAGGAGGAGGESIHAAIDRQLRRAGHDAAERVFLLTQPRSWGWLFNPVSFYFCYRNGSLVNLVAEITNTPWNEVHSYVLDTSGISEDEVEISFPKRFHVSPFLPMDIEYRWRIKLRDDDLQIAMRLMRGGEEVFFAGLYLHGAPITARALRRGALVYPIQNVRTLARIYWQALRLWMKGAPVHAHPGGLEEISPT